MSGDTLSTYWPFLVGATGAIATIGWLYRALRRLIILAVGTYNTLEQVHQIVTPNGGTSMADKLNGLVETQDNIIRGQIEDKEWQQNTDIRLKTLELAIIELRRAQDVRERLGPG